MNRNWGSMKNILLCLILLALFVDVSGIRKNDIVLKCLSLSKQSLCKNQMSLCDQDDDCKQNLKTLESQCTIPFNTNNYNAKCYNEFFEQTTNQVLQKSLECLNDVCDIFTLEDFFSVTDETENEKKIVNQQNECLAQISSQDQKCYNHYKLCDLDCVMNIDLIFSCVKEKECRLKHLLHFVNNIKNQKALDYAICYVRQCKPNVFQKQDLL